MLAYFHRIVCFLIGHSNLSTLQLIYSGLDRFKKYKDMPHVEYYKFDCPRCASSMIKSRYCNYSANETLNCMTDVCKSEHLIFSKSQRKRKASQIKLIKKTRNRKHKKAMNDTAKSA